MCVSRIHSSICLFVLLILLLLLRLSLSFSLKAEYDEALAGMDHTAPLATPATAATPAPASSDPPSTSPAGGDAGGDAEQEEMLVELQALLEAGEISQQVCV
jgi:hypothetical protein